MAQQNPINPVASSRPFAVITGASSGIGYELAQVFAKNNFDILVTAEDAGIVEAAEAFRVFGGEVDHLQTNLAAFKGVDALYQKIQSLNRPIDTVVFNAGVGTNGEFQNIPMDEELNVIQLNITSTVHLAKHVVKDMIAQRHGRLLFTSSLAAEMPAPYCAVYAASKSFIQSFSEALRFELKAHGIIVTALQPGPTETKFFERADMMDTKVAQAKKDSAADVAQQGFDALMAGKDHVVTGFKNKLQSAMGKFIPETMSAQIHSTKNKPGSGLKN